MGENRDKYIILLGAGGIGANLALSLIGKEDEYTVGAIFDDDVLELSNFNRLPFPIHNVGLNKVDVVNMTNTSLRAENCRVSSVDDLNTRARRLFANTPRIIPKLERIGAESRRSSDGVIVDCRDVLDTESMFSDIDIKLSYNGGNIICITFNPSEGAWKTLSSDESFGSYETTPSFYIPPVLISEIFVGILSFMPRDLWCGPKRRIKNTAKVTLNIEDLILSSIIRNDESSEEEVGEEP